MVSGLDFLGKGEVRILNLPVLILVAFSFAFGPL